MEINTENISDEFIITKNQSSQDIGSERVVDTKLKGKRVDVSIKVTLRLVYNGTSLRIISFYPLNSDDSVENRITQNMTSALNIEYLKDERNTENEEIKDLKDFKNFISIRSEPSAIRSINYACIILIIFICVGLSLMFVLWFSISTT